MLESDLENKPTKLVVQFTEGRKVLRAVCEVENVVETEGYEINDALERVATLSTIDEKWTDHLRELDELKTGIGLRAFGQKDPLLEYKMEAFNLFEQMLEDLNRDVVSTVFKAGPLAQGEPSGTDRGPVRGRSRGPRLDRSRAQATHEGNTGYGVNLQSGGGGGAAVGERRDPTTKAQPVVTGERVGRNDPCPCGSGKKYKHCHGRA
jgi:preprotein translocase subunit SecA